MEEKVWIYLSKTGTGFELKGADIISAFDAFINADGSYLIEHSYSDIKGDEHFFIYEWDKSQKKRRTIFEGYQRQNILTGFAKNVDIPENLKLAIFKNYTFGEEETENANS
jgi:hypothetical protein